MHERLSVETVNRRVNSDFLEGRTDQRNAQINFSLINLLLFK